MEGQVGRLGDERSPAGKRALRCPLKIDRSNVLMTPSIAFSWRSLKLSIAAVWEDPDMSDLLRSVPLGAEAAFPKEELDVRVAKLQTVLADKGIDLYVTSGPRTFLPHRPADAGLLHIPECVHTAVGDAIPRAAADRILQRPPQLLHRGHLRLLGRRQSRNLPRRGAEGPGLDGQSASRSTATPGSST